MTRTILTAMPQATAVAASEHLIDLGLDTTIRIFNGDVSVVTYRNPLSDTEISLDARLTLFGVSGTTVLFDSAASGPQPLAATSAVDYQWDDVAMPCPHCMAWWAEQAVGPDDELVLREWHSAACPTAIDWAA